MRDLSPNRPTIRRRSGCQQPRLQIGVGVRQFGQKCPVEAHQGLTMRQKDATALPGCGIRVIPPPLFELDPALWLKRRWLLLLPRVTRWLGRPTPAWPAVVTRLGINPPM